MTLYGVILSLHVGAALLLAAALGIDACILYGLGLYGPGQKGSPDAIRLGLNLWRAVPPMAGGAGLLLLLSGLYLTGQMGAWRLGWPMVALAALVLIGAFGGIASKRMRTLRQSWVAAEARPAESSGRLEDPILKLSISMRIMLVFAAVLLMTMKPGLSGSLGITGVAAILGVLLALPLSPKGGRSRQSHPSDAGAASARS